MLKQVTYQEYLDFLKKYPGLNVHGYHCIKPRSHSIRSNSWQQRFVDEWQYFRSISESEEGFKQFLIVLAWFEKYQIPKTKHCVSQSHSYHLKHVVEEEFGCYIYNGSFITGALFCGCTTSTRKSVLNPSFNLKYSCIKKNKRLA